MWTGHDTVTFTDSTLEVGMDFVADNADSVRMSGSKIYIGKDLSIAVKNSCELMNGSLEITGDMDIISGRFMLNRQVTLTAGGDVTVFTDGQIDTHYNSATSQMKISGNLVFHSARQSYLEYGTLYLEGDLIQEDGGYEESLKAQSVFHLIFQGQNVQHIRLAYPKNVTLGDMDFRESVGVVLPDEIHGDYIAGFDKIRRKDTLKFYLSSISLQQDETIDCSNVEWYGGSLTTDKYSLRIQGNLKVSDMSSITVREGNFTVDGDFTCALKNYYRQEKGKLKVDGSLVIRRGDVQLQGSSVSEIEGDIRVIEDGRLYVYGNSGITNVTVQGDLVINSARQTYLYYGTLLLKGDLIQQDSGYPQSLSSYYSFNILFEGEERQTIDLAYPESATLGTMDFRKSTGVSIPDEIHSGAIYGFDKIGRKEKQKFYLHTSTLQQDETIDCENVEWHGGGLYTAGYNFRVKGDLEVSEAGIFEINGGNITVDGDFVCEFKNYFRLKNGKLTTGGDLTIKLGEIQVQDNASIRTEGDIRLIGTGRLYVYGNRASVLAGGSFIIDSTVQTSLWMGSLTIRGDLVQKDSGYPESLRTNTSFEILFEGEERQTIDLAYPETATLGIMDFRGSTGVTIPDEIHGITILGFDKIGRKEKQEFYLSTTTLYQDETIDCENVEWHGNITTGTYELHVKGNLDTYAETHTDVYLKAHGGTVTVDGDFTSASYRQDSGSLAVGGDLTIERGDMQLSGSVSVRAGGDLRIVEDGQMLVFGNRNLDTIGINVQGDVLIDSARQSTLGYGNLTIGGDFIQRGDSNIENLKIQEYFGVELVGEKRQTIDLEGVEEIPNLDISESKEVYFAEEYCGGVLRGLEKLVSDGETLYVDYEDVYACGDGIIDGNLKCYGALKILGGTLTVKGKYTQYKQTCVEYGGKLITTGDFTADTGMVEIQDGTIHVKGDAHIKKSAYVSMFSTGSCRFRTDGDYISASRSDGFRSGGGILELKGDLIQNSTATSFGIDLSHTQLLFTGTGIQLVMPNSLEFGYVASIDMRDSFSVDFACNILSADRILGFSHIRCDQSDKTLILENSTIHLEESDYYNGTILLKETSFYCDGYTFHVYGNLEQLNSYMVLNNGCLYIENNYSIMGIGYLMMTEKNDILRIDGGFYTEAEDRHDGLLSNGRMELRGNFNQNNNKYSFKTTDDFVIAFMGDGQQKVYFENYGYSGFANIDPNHCIYVPSDTSSEMEDRILYRMKLGFCSGLEEALGIEILEDTTQTFLSITGIVIVGGVCIKYPVVGFAMAVLVALASLYAIARTAGGIYGTLTGDENIYDKAELFAHDAALMLMSICYLAGSVTAIVKDFSKYKPLLKRLIGSQEGFCVTDFLVTSTGKERIVDYDSFIKYATELVEEESLNYIKSVVNKEKDNIETMQKIGELLEEAKGKLGRLLKLDEMKAGIDLLLVEGDLEHALTAVERYSKGIKSGRDLLKKCDKLENGSDEWFEWLEKIIKYRKEQEAYKENTNIAAMKYKVNGENKTVFFESGKGLHSEERAAQFIKEHNILEEDIIAFFTEREPCMRTASYHQHDCAGLLSEIMPNTDIFYAYDYATHQDGKDALKELKKIIKKYVKGNAVFGD